MSDATARPDDLPDNLFDELHELITARLDDSISDEQLQRLEDLVINHPEARRIYVEHMHDSVALTWWATTPAPHLGDQEAERYAQSLLSAVGTELCEHETTQVIRAPQTTTIIGRLARTIRPRHHPLHFVVAVSALTLMFWAGLMYVIQTSSPRNKTVVVEVTSTQDAVWQTDATRYDVGTKLRRGDRLDLELGFVELTFGRGEKIVVQGPAALSVFDAKTARLDRGKALAHVGPTGKGFTILTPSVRVVDLGTRFGVQVSGEGRVTEIQVIKGVVRVTPTATSATPFSRRLRSGKALRVDQSSDSGNRPQYAVTERPADKRAFAALASVMNVASGVVKDDVAAEPTGRGDGSDDLIVSSTGRGLDLHAQDPNWRVVAATNVPGFTPRQAVVVEMPGSWLDNDRNTSQWISFSAATSAPGDASFTFETTIDLTGFDPSSVRIDVRFAVDNELHGCRVNGDSVTVPPAPDEYEAMRSMHHFVIDRGFRSGVNTIQFDVGNIEVGSDNALAVRLHMTGTAKRIIQKR